MKFSAHQNLPKLAGKLATISLTFFLFLMFLPVPLAFASTLGGKVVNIGSQYATCPDAKYYYGGWSVVNDRGSFGWFGPITNCQGEPKYQVELCPDGKECRPTVPNGSADWTQDAPSYDTSQGTPRFGWEFGDAQDFEATIYPFFYDDKSKRIPDGALFDHWEFWYVDDYNPIPQFQQSGTTIPPEGVRIRIYENKANQIWFYYRSSAVPTPTPEPPNCAIQQTNPPETDSPIVYYTLTDTYTVTVNGGALVTNNQGQLGTWVHVEESWNWGGKITLPNQDETQMPFSRQAADYLEGSFQDAFHRTANLLTLPSADFNQYTGRVIKLTPNLITDQRRIDYVNAVLDTNSKPGLVERDYTYTDIENQGPEKTIADLAAELGPPNPITWQRYWAKIPLSTNDKSQGWLVAPSVSDLAGTGQNYTCGPQHPLTVPDNYRLDNISWQLNQALLPKILQFDQQNLAFNPTSKYLNPSLGAAINNTGGKNATSKPKLELTSTNPAGKSAGTSPTIYTIPDQRSGNVLAETTAACGVEVNPVSKTGWGSQICFNTWTGTNILKRLTPETYPEATIADVWVPAATCQDCSVIIPETGLCSTTPCAGSTQYTFTHSEEIGFKAQLPYLENIWKKTTYGQTSTNLDPPSQNPGFFDIFTPSIGGKVLVSQDKYSQHAQTPISLTFTDQTNSAINPLGDPTGTLIPQSQEGLYPRYMGGVSNAQQFVQEALWAPRETDPDNRPQRCLANLTCSNNPFQTYNTYCTPDCTSSGRTCFDSPSCDSPLINCTASGGDAYCAGIPTGGCGDYGNGQRGTCDVTRTCQSGGNCVTECNNCQLY